MPVGLLSLKNFKMDSGTLIVGAVLIALCILPVVITEISRKNREKKLFRLIKSEAEGQNCNITKFEHCCNNIIGLDEANKVLFFIKKRDSGIISRFADLKEIQNCKAQNLSGSSDNNGTDYQFTRKVELVLKPGIKNKPDVVIEIFDSEEGRQLSGELQLAEKWSEMIRGILKKR